MNKYDVIIVGGGTAGVSCAWNCGKRGLKTLIIEKNSFLGGSISSSLVIPAMKTADNAINTDFFDELYKKLNSIHGAITYSDRNKGWFNPELTKIALDMLLIDVNVEVLFESTVKSINVQNKNILSVCIDAIDTDKKLDSLNKLLLAPIETSILVDATGDAKICEKLNCNFLENFENIFQPMSLRFIMSGVNIKKFKEWLLEYDTDKDVSTGCVIGDEIHVSTAYTWDTNKKWALKPLFDKALANKELEEADCNYFQLFSVAGTRDSIAFNAPRLINNRESRSMHYIDGRLSILRLANFCKKYLPGFENAHISNIADSLGIRLSRLVEGQYVYKYDDIVSGKQFKNPVVISNYPVDIHSNKKNESKLEKVSKEYQLPLESLIVKGYKNLFVIGRCISAEAKAQAALRIIPSCFSMGEGLAKYIASIK